MLYKLTSQNLNDICQALSTFAEARSKPVEDRDVILTVIKMHGQKTLRAVRLSEVSWHGRLIHHFGLGGSNLASVANFLQTREPFLPRHLRLYNKESLSFHYTDEAVEDLLHIEKAQLKRLKKQKREGCEIFKRCICKHNHDHSNKIYILLQEDERKCLKYRYQHPMGPLNSEKAKTLATRYKPPIIDENEFLYLHPRSRRNLCQISPNVLGFCYEYGLGTKKNIQEAIHHYRIAIQKNAYAACYNLARLLLVEEKFDEAIDLLKKCEGIITEDIRSLEKACENLDEERKNNIQKCILQLEKRLKLVYLVIIDIYNKVNDPILKAEYEQKDVHTNFPLISASD